MAIDFESIQNDFDEKQNTFKAEKEKVITNAIESIQLWLNEEIYPFVYNYINRIFSEDSLERVFKELLETKEDIQYERELHFSFFDRSTFFIKVENSAKDEGIIKLIVEAPLIHSSHFGDCIMDEDKMYEIKFNSKLNIDAHDFKERLNFGSMKNDDFYTTYFLLKTDSMRNTIMNTTQHLWESAGFNIYFGKYSNDTFFQVFTKNPFYKGE